MAMDPRAKYVIELTEIMQKVEVINIRIDELDSLIPICSVRGEGTMYDYIQNKIRRLRKEKDELITKGKELKHDE